MQQQWQWFDDIADLLVEHIDHARPIADHDENKHDINVDVDHAVSAHLSVDTGDGPECRRQGGRRGRCA